MIRNIIFLNKKLQNSHKPTGVQIHQKKRQNLKKIFDIRIMQKTKKKTQKKGNI